MTAQANIFRLMAITDIKADVAVLDTSPVPNHHNMIRVKMEVIPNPCVKYFTEG